MKNELEKKNYYLSLSMLYGKLLTDKQKDILEEYLGDDLSFSEIGENHSISKSAVSDTIKTVLTKLDHYEDTLHLLLKYHQIEKKLDDITNSDNEKTIEEIKELLNYGI